MGQSTPAEMTRLMASREAVSAGSGQRVYGSFDAFLFSAQVFNQFSADRGEPAIPVCQTRQNFPDGGGAQPGIQQVADT